MDTVHNDMHIRVIMTLVGRSLLGVGKCLPPREREECRKWIGTGVVETRRAKMTEKLEKYKESHQSAW